jgi:hypothetical protein
MNTSLTQKTTRAPNVRAIAGMDLTFLALNFYASRVSAQARLWTKDNPTDTGAEPSVGTSYESPDIWVYSWAYDMLACFG